MRHIEDRESLEHRRMCLREAPGDDRAPVVTHDRRFLATERAKETGDVADELLHVVGGDALGLVRLVVAPKIGSDAPVPGRGDRLELVPPRPPELRKAVEEDNERSRRVAGLCDVERDLSDVDAAMGQFHRARLSERAKRGAAREARRGMKANPGSPS